MSQELKVCDVDEELIEIAKKFRFAKEKTNAALIMKIDHKCDNNGEDQKSGDKKGGDKKDGDDMCVIQEEFLEDFTAFEDLCDELPGHEPRYVLMRYAYKHDDGRQSFPFVFIFISPEGCKTEIQMKYAGSKLGLIAALKISKSFELRCVEELTEEWLKEKLKFFG